MLRGLQRLLHALPASVQEIENRHNIPFVLQRLPIRYLAQRYAVRGSLVLGDLRDILHDLPGRFSDGSRYLKSFLASAEDTAPATPPSKSKRVSKPKPISKPEPIAKPEPLADGKIRDKKPQKERSVIPAFMSNGKPGIGFYQFNPAHARVMEKSPPVDSTQKVQEPASAIDSSAESALRTPKDALLAQSLSGNNISASDRRSGRQEAIPAEMKWEPLFETFEGMPLVADRWRVLSGLAQDERFKYEIRIARKQARDSLERKPFEDFSIDPAGSGDKPGAKFYDNCVSIRSDQKEMAVAYALDEDPLRGHIPHRFTYWTDASCEADDQRNTPTAVAVVSKVRIGDGRREWKVVKACWTDVSMQSGRAELVAIILALREGLAKIRDAAKAAGGLWQKTDKPAVVVFSDSAECLQAIARQSGRYKYEQLQEELAAKAHVEIKSIRSWGAKVELHWVPGHAMIPGNDAANLVATQGARARSNKSNPNSWLLTGSDMHARASRHSHSRA
jgi:ribonuclease HI